ncbi:MAG: hypothetical protein U0263_20655 [Polyangiaceae bacterium]
MLGLYRAYRRWAHENVGPKQSVWLGACAGALGAGLVSASHIFGFRMTTILGWLCVVGGPIAALDAFGAAVYRGRRAEGWVRLLLILAICATGAAVAFSLH